MFFTFFANAVIVNILAHNIIAQDSTATGQGVCEYVKCGLPPKICPYSQPPIKLPNECCAVCLNIEPEDCSTVKCGGPKYCPNGEPSHRVSYQCCPVCFDVNPIKCDDIICPFTPRICQNGKRPVKPHNGCCAVCPRDCIKVKCTAPRRICKEGQVRRPKGECCDACRSVFK